MNLKKYIAELKKRHVFKAGLAYLIGAWVFIEVAALVLDAFSAPPYFLKTILIIIAIGFPVWLVFSWVYDLTPEGITKTKNTNQNTSKSPKINQRLNRAIIAFLSIAIVLLVVNQVRSSTKNELRVSKGIEKSIDQIAVLPFLNSKSDPESDYLGFAMADQIIGGLIYLNNISVRPSASIRPYEQQAIDPKKVGNDLQVDYVLIGNYLKEGNKIRLNVELINVQSNNIIWREPIEVDFQSAFELQDIVAQEVIDGMNLQFTQQELNRIRKDIPKDPLAYEYFLRSISYESTTDGERMAIALLEKSIELDSTYAPAYNQLGDRLHKLSIYGLLSPEETQRAEKAYLKALSLNNELIDALGNLAEIFTETNRKMEAGTLIKQILEINPNSAQAHYSLGYIYRYAGLNEKAILEMERAIVLDPKNQGFRSINVSYLFFGKFEEAIDAGKKFEESPFTIMFQGMALLKLDRFMEALECFHRVIELDPGSRPAIVARTLKAFIEGNSEEALSHAAHYEQFDSPDAEVWYFSSLLYGILSDTEGILRCLNKAVDGGFFNYPAMLSESYLDLARDDPEFHKILEKAKERHLDFKKRFFQ